ncbi:MAG: ATP-binding protein, partial [Candidatus Thorarchaeota archaeon]
IFEQYVKEDPSTQGAGLGLTVVKNLVEAHGGVVKAISEGRNSGAIFTFTLPATKEVYEQLMKKRDSKKS